MADKYVIYKDTRGEYRWRYVSANGRTIADSGEGYSTKANCENGIQIMKDSKYVTVEDTTVTKSAYGGW